MENLPKSREDALLCGSAFYFTGVPCCRNHVCKRRTKNKKCELCAKEICQKFVLANKDAAYQQHIARKLANPEKYLLAGATTRSRKYGYPCTITITDIVIPEYCPILNIKLEINTGRYNYNSPSLDKIIPSLGYVPGNIMVISMRANMIKNNATVTEIEKVYNYLVNLNRNLDK